MGLNKKKENKRKKITCEAIMTKKFSMQLSFQLQATFFCCFFILTTTLPIFFFELIIRNRKKIPSNNFFTTSATTTTSFFVSLSPLQFFLRFTRLAADALGSLVTSKQKCTYLLTLYI